MTSDTAATPSGRRLLLVHAHPDDETTSSGVTMARYAAEGAQVTLVTCTLGEEGEVLVESLAHLAAAQDDQLGPHRMTELAAAMEVLGVSDYRFLGGPGRWRDSGMMGEPSNDRADCFWRADLLEAAAELVAIIREVRPQVLVTYNEFGGYGHPDHIQAHRVAMYAYELASVPSFRPQLGPAWQISKVYWAAIGKSFIQKGMDALVAAGGTGFFGVTNADDLPFVVADEDLTTMVDGLQFERAKMLALRKHASQITEDSPFFEMTELLGPGAMGYETFVLVAGELGTASTDENGWESDLFDGIKV